jgi:hypothetical protein
MRGVVELELGFEAGVGVEGKRGVLRWGAEIVQSGWEGGVERIIGGRGKLVGVECCGFMGKKGCAVAGGTCFGLLRGGCTKVRSSQES